MDYSLFCKSVACHDCGLQPEYPNNPESLSSVWVVEFEDTIAAAHNQLFFVCTNCAPFYQQLSECRTAYLPSYTRADVTRLQDFTFDITHAHQVVEPYRVILAHVMGAEEAARRAQAAERVARCAQKIQHIKPPRTLRPGSRRPLPPGLRYSVLERDGFRCKTCGRTPEQHGVVLHVDHIVAVARGGTNDPGNLRALCAECNVGKSDR